jgi:hypothetical protein
MAYFILTCCNRLTVADTEKLIWLKGTHLEFAKNRFQSTNKVLLSSYGVISSLSFTRKKWTRN